MVFYYTFGSSEDSPYQGGWVEVHADILLEAHKKFRERFPDRTPGVLNCSDYYESLPRRFKVDGNLGAYCHEELGKEEVEYRMTREAAKKAAETRVYVHMCRGDIEDGCRERGIKARGRADMERKLIDAITEEYMKK